MFKIPADSGRDVQLPYASLEEFGKALTEGLKPTTRDDSSCIRLADGPASEAELRAEYARLTGRHVPGA